MKEDIFDNIIKEKLDGFSAITQTDDVWSAFESSSTRKSHQDVESQDADFDQIIKNSLQQVVPNYRTEHWQLLKNQLKTIDERKNIVFTSKIMEFAAIFLIVLTFFNWSAWMPIDKRVDPLLYADVNLIYQKIKKSQDNIEIDRNNKNATEQQIVSNHRENLKHNTKSEINNHNSDNAGIMLVSSLFKNESDNLWQKNGLALINEATEQLNIDNYKDAETMAPAFIITYLQNKESKDIASIANEITNQTNEPVLDYLSHNSPENLVSEYALSFPMKMSTIQSKPEFALSVFGTGDINLINTPFDKLYSRASYNKEALNNSLGVNISKKINQLEVETGITYAKREYQPDIFGEAFGPKENYYSEVSLNKISFDIASIPLNFKYHFINQANWGAYLLAGAALNLVMNADYDINQIKVLGRPAPERNLPVEPRLEEKPFIKGLISGESINDNYFVSVGFGFGIQKKIFNNTSIYIQPSYNRQILNADIGIGPNKDKIHTSSLQFGVKTVLN